MTDTWKPQPGKPAMTRDEKTLVTDLNQFLDGTFWSAKMRWSWTASGESKSGLENRYLIEPTAAILAAHGIDADGNPTADGKLTPPPSQPEHDVESEGSLRARLNAWRIRAQLLEERMTVKNKALLVLSKWALDTSTLDTLAELEERMFEAGLTLADIS